MTAEEKREGFLEKNIFNIATTIVLVLAAVLYPLVWFLLKTWTGHELPGKPVFSVQNLIATPVMLLTVGLAWLLYKRKSLQSKINSWEFDIRARALKRLESGWISLFLEPSIEGMEPMCLPLRFTPSHVEHPGIEEATSILKEHDRDLPPETYINQIFDESGRSLLVLGQPGSGKTTLLLQLSKHLHGLATEDPLQPIPVFLRLANWNRWWGVFGGKRAFERWLIRQMKLSYFIDKDLGREWLRAGKVILLLDGLDEVAPIQARRSCHNAIHGLTRQLPGGLVVSSRIEEYSTLNPLPMNFAVEALPVTEAQVLQYIATIPSAHRLALALKYDLGAITVLTTPFALTLALAAYSNKSKLKWPAGKFSISRLLDDFVEARMSVLLKKSRYKKDAYLRWMRNLAQCSQSGKQTVFDPVELRERWLSNAWQHAACKGVVILVVTAFCFTAEAALWYIHLVSTDKCWSGTTLVSCVSRALSTGDVRPIWNTIPGNLMYSALQGFIAACVIGLPVGTFGSLFQLRPIQLAPAGFLSSRIRQSLRVFVVASAGISVALAPIGLILRKLFTQQLWPDTMNWGNPFRQLKGPLHAALGEVIGNTLTVKTSALIGLCIGLLLALTTFLSSEVNSNRTLSSAMRTSITIALSFGVSAGILLWLFLPDERILDLALLHSHTVQKPDIPFGGALLILLAAGGLFTIRYYVTRLMMVMTRCGPWSYERFLDLATECWFLRPVNGPDRIFRHPMLRDYFADPSPRDDSQTVGWHL
jgi:energy-coupling factor transporter ATP-binding protein EcfA2